MKEQDPAKHQQALELAARACLAVDIRGWEPREREDILAGLLPDIEGAAWAAVETLDAIMEAYEGSEADDQSGPRIEPDHSIHGELEGGLVDVAFMARWDLRQRITRLGSARASSDPWVVIARCSSLRRRTLKSLYEVERRLCELAGLPTLFSGLHSSDVDTAIATRRVYRTFTKSTRSVAEGLESGRLEIAQALRLSAANLAKLIGRDVYEDLRVEDRQQIRAMQARIFAWARVPEPDAFAARRLWMDVTAFAELLSSVQRRVELVEHDAKLIREAVVALRQRDKLGPELGERLLELEGRDPALDELLALGARGSRLLPPLTRLHAQLAHSLGQAPLELVDSSEVHTGA